jgi:hypothetical protein
MYSRARGGYKTFGNLSEIRGRPAGRFLGEVTLHVEDPRNPYYIYFYCDHPKQEPEKIDNSGSCLG